MKSRVHIQLDGNRRVYPPGATISGRFWLDGVVHADVVAVELSILWHSEGKGDEDLAVHHFERIGTENGRGFDPRHPIRFSTRLPNSPISYDGVLLSIAWCVRVRVFFRTSREIADELRFRLGLPTRQMTTRK